MVRIRNIKGFLETSFVDWPGRIASVVFLAGCNLRCPFCHNHRLVMDSERLEDLSLGGILSRLQGLKGWVDGVCITGGEPTLHPQLWEMMAALRGTGLLIKLDTNGTRPAVLRRLLDDGLLDAVSMDIKAPFRPDPYARCAGVEAPLDRITRSVCILQEADLEVEFRTTVVPGLLTQEEVVEIGCTLPRWIPYRLQTFRPGDVLDSSLQRVVPYDDQTLDAMRARLAQSRPGRAGSASWESCVLPKPPPFPAIRASVKMS